MAQSIQPGLLILHGNQLEELRSAVFQWLRGQPLAPLEQEIFLVQSNGVAEWLKIALAEETGLCGATRVALPARLLWEIYRGMLGHARVPPISAFDKGPLTWRLMRLLPQLLAQEAFAPLRHFLRDGDPERRLQLAERLADLFDQYQVYRADWLEDWASGLDQLRNARGEAVPLAPDQRWQAELWRAVAASVPEGERGLGRASVHAAFVEAVQRGDTPLGRLPRRIVLFGVSALPYQTLQAMASLARFTQVVIAVPNPCRYYWGDIIEGRDLLRAARHRHAARKDIDLSAVPLEALHAHSHPLLASWGRQGRDYIRMLDEFDTASDLEGREDKLRVDLFSEEEGATLLAQVQAAVRDMLPLAEHPQVPPEDSDRSIEFHVAHSVQREVEILHDQLLAMFAADPSLRPRDVVVMVPDIDVFTASIRAVFGQHRRHDPRFIPHEIGDVNDRSVNPLLVALEWLLRLPQQRCRQSEVRDLLDVPALARRFGLAEDDLPTLGQWIEGAGVRWGLDAEHRAGLGLAPAGEQNAWMFGVRRMLLGYAAGNGGDYAGIEPYSEVGGLDAALAGSLAQLIEALLAWRERLGMARRPADWAEQARLLLAGFFSDREETDRLTLARLDDALDKWLETCEDAGFDEEVPLATLREAWMGGLDEPSLEHQFVSGGVTFCTLMPMRAVPFRVVCLLGMNDGDFPRRASRADFDLLALPGMARPGDRSRRDDDRYLMLEAVLAARDKLYVSWVGRNVRDNSEQPPSVLVAQLCDYLQAGWKLDLKARTTLHALQPFSRAYFEAGGLLTYAGEWRAAYASGEAPQVPSALPPFEVAEDFRLNLAALESFLRQPVKYFFRERLGVRFNELELVGQDDEPFVPDNLQRYGLESAMLDDSGERESLDEVPATLARRAGQLGRQGVLPIGLLGERMQAQLVAELCPVRQQWLELAQDFGREMPNQPVALSLAGMQLDDWLVHLRSNETGTLAWLDQVPSRLLSGEKKLPRGDKLLRGWLRQLAAAAQGVEMIGFLVGRDSIISMRALDQAFAREVLENLVRLWREGMDHPLPTACKTALEFIANGEPHKTYDGDKIVRGERKDPSLARMWPEYAELRAEPGFEASSIALYKPLADWMANSLDIVRFEGNGK